MEINSAWELIKENINISAKESLGYYELKKHKPWFDEACSKLVDQRKQAKFQWLQDPSETRNNLVKDENGDLPAESHSILNRWKNYVSQLLNVHNVSDVRQIEVHMAEPLVPGSSCLEVEIAIAKLKKYKSSGGNEILAEPIQAGNETLLSVIHKLIHSIWNKKELPDRWKEPIIVPVHRKGDKTNCRNYCGISLLSTSYKILSNILLLRLSPYIHETI
jgi:hypothetical protein